MGNEKYVPEGEVIEMISILKEFVMEVKAKLYRYMKENKINQDEPSFVAETARYVGKMYNEVFKLETLEEANIMRGKIQMVDEIIKEITADV